MFAIPAILCFLAGVRLGWGDAWTWVGGGIAAYGAIYFGFHDVLVHQRISHRYLPRSPYMRRIVQAHRLHHAVETKHGTVSFGFLWAPPITALKARLAAGGRSGVRAPAGRSEEHTSELQSLMRISYAVFCLKKKKKEHELM